MKGTEIVSGELSPEISPVIVVEDDTAEWQFLQGVRLCASSLAQGAVVAQNTMFRYRNPVGSGVIARFDVWGVTPTTDCSFVAGYSSGAADFATAGATALRDHRWQQAAGSKTAIQVSRANDITFVLTDGFWGWDGLADVSQRYDQPLILLPGEAIDLGTITLNVEIRLFSTWTERQLPALEA